MPSHGVLQDIRARNGSQPERSLLFFFVGGTGRDPLYSGGARQELAKLFRWGLLEAS